MIIHMIHVFIMHTEIASKFKILKYTRLVCMRATNAPTAPLLIDFNVCVHLNGSDRYCC